MTNFADLRESEPKLARAWAVEATTMSLWDYGKRRWLERRWMRCNQWAICCRSKLIKRVARMIKAAWEGVANAVKSPITNSRAEGYNGKIQLIKRKACGYSNRERFRMAIHSLLGGLNLYVGKVSHAHM